MKNIAIDYSASLATSSQVHFFLFLSLKCLSCLSYNTDNFLIASHYFWSLSVAFFALYPLLFSFVLLFEEKKLKKPTCLSYVLCSHDTNDAASMKQSHLFTQGWSKISKHFGILASLHQCWLTLTSLTSIMFTQWAVLMQTQRRSSADISKCEPDIKERETSITSLSNFLCQIHTYLCLRYFKKISKVFFQTTTQVKKEVDKEQRWLL